MMHARFWGGLVLVAALVAGIGGCNTVRGMGQDLQQAGQRIQEVAR